jgi:hypothetical protein
VKFPGSKLLYSLDLTQRGAALDELMRSCQQVGLTGFAELSGPDCIGMIFYYLGGQANTLYRQGNMTRNGQEALAALRERVAAGEGLFSVYELPLDMAHLLRGVTNRRRLAEAPSSVGELQGVLERLEIGEHTGTLEVQTQQGAAMLLLVRGRVSNSYWETSDGLTFEKGEARQKLDHALPRSAGTTLYLSDFSQVVWKGRHEVETTPAREFDPRKRPPPAEIAAEEDSLRDQLISQLQSQLPALVQAFVFDLMTGSTLARRGRGTDALRVSLLADKVPPLTLYLRAQGDDQVELIELGTAQLALLIAIVPEAQEAIAVIADRSQPTALIGAALARAGRAYAASLHPSRGPAAAR